MQSPLAASDPLLDVNEIAAEFGSDVGHRAVRRMWREVDGLRWVMAGKKKKSRRSWVNAYIERKAVSPNPSRRGRS